MDGMNGMERLDTAMRNGIRILVGSVWTVLWALLLLAATQSARAEDTSKPADDEARIKELEEKVEILTEEMGRLESIFAVPDDLALESFSGLGPAASKVYKRDRGLSIGGYGEVRLRTFHNKGEDDQDDIFDALRAVLYVGYKFNDNWVVNTEFEFEHGGTGGDGSVSAEFITLDYLWKEEVNLRGGLLLIPMGFVNEIHEPNFFFGAERPEIERLILPSTWRENGVGIFGRVADRVEYRVYVVNGFKASGFSSGGLRGGRQKGSKALANDFAIVARVDVDAAPGLLFGGSVYTGQAGQEEEVGADGATGALAMDLPDSQTTIYELHGQYKGHGASFRALWTEAFIDEAGRLSRVLGKNPTESIAQHMRGWYVEVAYDVLPLVFEDTRMSLEPYFRFEQYDTQRDVADLGFARDKSKDIDLYVAGLQFKPIPEVVFKLDYRRFELGRGGRADEVQALLGYVF
jgi:hypothetical protein